MGVRCLIDSGVRCLKFFVPRRETTIASKMVTEEVLLHVAGAVWNKH